MFKKYVYSILFIIPFLLSGCFNETKPIKINRDFENEIPVYSKKPNWLDAVTIVDDKVMTEDIKVDDSEVRMTRVGKYHVIFKVDKKEIILDVYIVDREKPYLDGLKNLSMEVNGELPNFLDGINVSDNYDKNIVLSEENVDLSRVHTNRVGQYRVAYRVKDSSGNELIETIVLNIVDTTPPQFINLSDELYIEAGMDYDFISGVIVHDNCDDLYITETNVNLANLESSKLGTYPIYYHIEDLSGNTEIKKVMVHVIDTTPPMIFTPNEMGTTINSDMPNILERVFSFDNLDGEIILDERNIDTSEVNLRVANSYKVYFVVQDSQGNQAKKTMTFIVYDPNEINNEE